jgi:glycine cleavage system H protein
VVSQPNDLEYTPEHEWVSLAGDIATVGITEYAAGQLGDIVFVQLPDVGSAVTAGDPCGELESTKSVSDLYAPVTGAVTEVNDDVANDPAVVNAEPYAAWLFRVRFSAPPLGLLSAAQYAELTTGGAA